MFRYAKSKEYNMNEVLIVMNFNETIHPFFHNRLGQDSKKLKE
jgi:hypothetical protein